MHQDLVYQNLVRKMQEILVVPPQNVGRFTPIYKAFAPYIKNIPWRILVPLAVVAAILVRLIGGVYLIKIVTLLQHGF